MSKQEQIKIKKTKRTGNTKSTAKDLDLRTPSGKKLPY